MIGPGRDALPERRPDPAYFAQPPRHPWPIVVLGAGGIVADAHLPAYRKAGFPVAAVVDRVVPRAQVLAERYDIPSVHRSVPDAVAAVPVDVVFDLALPPGSYQEVLGSLPDGAAVLIQKPLGNTWEESCAVVELCRAKGLRAAVNTQLRFAPYIAQARRLIADGVLGELYDIEVRVTVDTPWQRFPEVLPLPRLEINAHSIHYLDLVRSFVGDPTGVEAVTLARPGSVVANTRTQVILRYGARELRVVVGVNHDHDHGPRHQESFVRWEGTRGALHAQLGLLLDYPRGGPDRLELALRDRPGRGWSDVAFEGSWFPDAFIGSMSALQNHILGDVATLPTSVEDGLRTMAVVEAAYRSSDAGGRPLPPGPSVLASPDQVADRSSGDPVDPGHRHP